MQVLERLDGRFNISEIVVREKVKISIFPQLREAENNSRKYGFGADAPELGHCLLFYPYTTAVLNL